MKNNAEITDSMLEIKRIIDMTFYRSFLLRHQLSRTRMVENSNLLG